MCNDNNKPYQALKNKSLDMVSSAHNRINKTIKACEANKEYLLASELQDDKPEGLTKDTPQWQIDLWLELAIKKVLNHNYLTVQSETDVIQALLAE